VWVGGGGWGGGDGGVWRTKVRLARTPGEKTPEKGGGENSRPVKAPGKRLQGLLNLEGGSRSDRKEKSRERKRAPPPGGGPGEGVPLVPAKWVENRKKRLPSCKGLCGRGEGTSVSSDGKRQKLSTAWGTRGTHRTLVETVRKKRTPRLWGKRKVFRTAPSETEPQTKPDPPW